MNKQLNNRDAEKHKEIISDRGLSRRAFLSIAGMAVARLSYSQGVDSKRSIRTPAPGLSGGKRSSRLLDLSTLPNFCAHEHWGSIDSIGMVPEGFRADVECGATPSAKTGLFDILLDP